MRRPVRPQTRLAPPGRRARRALGATSLGLLAALGLPAAAGAGILTPERGFSPNQSHARTLYTIALVLGFLVFLAVEIGLITALVRFRARKGRVPAQIRGNTRLEVAWTAGAVVLVTILSVLVFVELGGIKNPPRTGPGGSASNAAALFASVDQAPPPGGQALHIRVNGQQYIWRFDYPNGAFSFETLVVPTDTTVTMDLTATDVGHQWWVPKLGPAFDAIPGYTNHTWMKIHQAGLYHGQCALLCGRGHANMVADVCAVSPPQYATFVDGQKNAITQSNKNIADERALQAKQGAAPGQPPTPEQLQFQVTAPSGPPNFLPAGCYPPRP